jgi:hypothetical protein
MLLQSHSLEKVSTLMTSKFPQPCAVCGTLTKGANRCEIHEAEYKANRNRSAGARAVARADRSTHKSKLYNSQYRRDAKLIRDTATHCHICKQAFMEGDRVEADHIIPGDIGGPLAAAHRLCNQRRGAKPL